MNIDYDYNDDISKNFESVKNSISGLLNNKNSIVTSTDMVSIKGLNNFGSFNQLFSPLIDKIMDKSMDLFISGDFDRAIDTLKQTVRSLGNSGIGTGVLNTQISDRIIKTIDGTINSIKFNSTRNKFKKTLIVLTNLKKQAKKINTPELRQKYNEALVSLIAISRFMKSIYKNRKYVSDNVLTGLKHLVNENFDTNSVEKVTL